MKLKYLKEITGVGGLNALKIGFTSLADSIGLSTAALGGFIGVAGGIAAIIGIWNAYKQSNLEAVEAGREAVSEWDELNNSIKSQADRINELRTALDSGTLTEQEAYDAKAELYEIQKQLTESYGEQVSGIDLVNGGLREQIGLLDQITASEATRFLNEQDKGIEEATKQMEKSNRHFYLGEYFNNGSEESKEINKILEKYKDSITTDPSSDGITTTIHFRGDAEEADKVLNDFMADIRKAQSGFDGSEMFDSIMENASRGVQEVGDILETYQGLYEKSKIWEMTSDTDKFGTDTKNMQTAAKWLKDYSAAIEDYNEALATGDTSQINEAAAAFNNVDASVQSLLNDGMAKYSDIFNDAREELNETAIANRNFIDAINGIGDAGQTNVKKFANELKKLNLSDIDFLDAFNTDGVQKGEDAVNSIVKAAGDFGIDDVNNLCDLLVEAGILTGNLSNEAKKMALSFDFSSEEEGFNSFISSIEESTSATGLAAESVENLKSRYKDLENYDSSKLFERTENGIHLNVKALNELEDAYESQKKTEISDHLKSLEEQYNNLTEKINECTNASDTAQLYSARDDILAQIEDTSILAAQYDGLTSAYNKWKEAQSASDERDSYEDIGKGYENAEKLINEGWRGDEEVTKYLDLMLSAENRVGTVEEQFARLKQTISGTNHSLMDYWKVDTDGNLTSDGLFDFLDDVNKKLGDTYAKIDESGNYSFDFSGDKLQTVADEFGTTTQVIELFIKAMKETGMDVDFEDSIGSLETLKTKAEEANDVLKQMGKTDYTFNFNTKSIDYLNEQISEAEEVLDKFKDEDGSINLDIDGAQEAASILGTLIYQKNTLAATTIFSVDTSQASSDIELAISKLQNFVDLCSNLELQKKLGVDTSQAQAEVDSALAAMADDEIIANLGIDTSSVDTAIAGINALTPEILINAGLNTELIDGYVPENKEATVTYHKDSKEVDGYNPKNLTRTVTFTKSSYAVDNYISSLSKKSITIPVTYKTSTVSGPSKAQGDPHTKKSGQALGGEEGPELKVSKKNGTYELIGAEGAEMFHYDKGDMIFNAKQTEQLLKNGKITSGLRRGIALAGGTVSSEGISFAGGAKGGTTTRRKSSGSTKSIASSSSKSSSSKSSSSSKAAQEAADAAEEFEETLDWIEVLIDRIERSISQLDISVSSTYRDWSERNNSLRNELSEVRREIDAQRKGYERYLQEANSIGLSEDWAQKVRDGQIDIEKITDETLSKQISDYREWYEKCPSIWQQVEVFYLMLGQWYIRTYPKANQTTT